MIRGGLKYREEHEYLKLAHENREYELEAEVRKWTAADFHNQSIDGEPVHIIRAGLANVSGLFTKLTVEQMVEEMTLKKEQVHILCDQATRKYLINSLPCVIHQGLTMLFSSAFL